MTTLGHEPGVGSGMVGDEHGVSTGGLHGPCHLGDGVGGAPLLGGIDVVGRQTDGDLHGSPRESGLADATACRVASGPWERRP